MKITETTELLNKNFKISFTSNVSSDSLLHFGNMIRVTGIPN